MASTDEARLRELLAEVSVDSEAFAAMLAALAPAEPKDGLTDPDDVPEPPDEAITKPGDLWLLGEHRLLCGDAGSEADLDRLLDGVTEVSMSGRPRPACATTPLQGGHTVTTIIDRHGPQIEALCRTNRVKRLDVFGSAIQEDFAPMRSDVDFLVEFESNPGLNTFHSYRCLRDELSRLLERPVDLVMPSAVRNRYVAREIAATREPLYGA